MAESEVDNSDVIRILVATDNHLGYGERDAVRGEDSFIAFEEVLEIAIQENVDFILLGGDLFHDAVPTQNALNKCMQLLRRFTFGDKPVEMEFLSDETLNFHNTINQSVNYKDPNLNISTPVFSIHGNHDDPSGFGRLSSLDLLSTNSLVNYFGRWTDLTKVDVKPILLRKGQTQLALYGLSHIHDARLARLFENYKVSLERPSEETGEWFNLMVLHQNRADRGRKNYVQEEILPKFLNLVIWGHEHDCRIEPEYNAKNDFYVSQPGSSVATSLSEGEALQKKVGLLTIYKTKFQMKSIPLQTVRPFVFESINLVEYEAELRLDEGDAANKVHEFAEDRVKAMIERSKAMLTEHPKQPTLPLIRLRLVFSNEDQMFNAIRFGQMFSKKVANPADLVHFKKMVKKVKHEGVELDKAAMNRAFEQVKEETSNKVEDLLERYFDTSKKLQLFNSKVLSEISFQLVEKGDSSAMLNILNGYVKRAVNHLMDTLPDDDDIGAQLTQLQQQITPDEILKMVSQPVASDSVASNRSLSIKVNNSLNLNGGDDIDVNLPISKPSRGGARGRGRNAARGGRGSSGATSSSKSEVTSPRKNTRTPRSGNAMPQLDVSINTTRRSGRTQEPSALESFAAAKSTRTRKAPVFVISDDSD